MRIVQYNGAVVRPAWIAPEHFLHGIENGSCVQAELRGQGNSTNRREAVFVRPAQVRDDGLSDAAMEAQKAERGPAEPLTTVQYPMSYSG